MTTNIAKSPLKEYPAKKYVESLKPQEKARGVAVFKPLEDFNPTEQPEVVIFFANPDQLSAMVYLLVSFSCGRRPQYNSAVSQEL